MVALDLESGWSTLNTKLRAASETGLDGGRELGLYRVCTVLDNGLVLVGVLDGTVLTVGHADTVAVARSVTRVLVGVVVGDLKNTDGALVVVDDNLHRELVAPAVDPNDEEFEQTSLGRRVALDCAVRVGIGFVR